MKGRRGRLRWVWAVVLALALSGTACAEDGFAWPQADRPREWSFPRDFGAHPAYRTEWWYFTGNLRDAEGGRYGYQFTVFRVALRPEPARPQNPWSVRDVFLAHLAVTDGPGGAFRYADRASRPGPGLAGAEPDDLEVWVLDWEARRGEDGVIRVRAREGEFGVDLELTPRKPPVLHGAGGLSRKGPRPGQASYYASLTDLATRGRVRTPRGEREVTGTSWFDQEFGSNQLAEDQAGWDWVSLHLSDGRDLMLYVLRRTDGAVEPASSGTLVGPDGTPKHLPWGSFELTPLAHWTSPRSGGRYPIRWRVRVPWAGIDLTVDPLLQDQELVTSGTTGVTYWEGAVWGSGASAGEPVTCEGYVELTGYAGNLGGIF
ncbi:MAG: carotenoid 1,2-hydratase [Candidatus Dadabacteria bacterium]|nr:MAG: carotenoid 1,2-hydratase [Candidatus Dadabacteria bacterium]